MLHGQNMFIMLLQAWLGFFYLDLWGIKSAFDDFGKLLEAHSDPFADLQFTECNIGT